MTSAQEMDDRERFRPSEREIDIQRWKLSLNIHSIYLDDAIDEWIEYETERRMAEDYADKLPFRRGI